MKTIWKFPVNIQDVDEIIVPEGAKFLCAQQQGKLVHLWALCIPDAPPRKVKVRCVGTGHPFYDSELFNYVGTVQPSFYKGLVFHFFVERIPA